MIFILCIQFNTPTIYFIYWILLYMSSLWWSPSKSIWNICLRPHIGSLPPKKMPQPPLYIWSPELPEIQVGGRTINSGLINPSDQPLITFPPRDSDALSLRLVQSSRTTMNMLLVYTAGYPCLLKCWSFWSPFFLTLLSMQSAKNMHFTRQILVHEAYNKTNCIATESTSNLFALN